MKRLLLLLPILAFAPAQEKDKRPPKPGVSTPGVKREMSAIKPDVVFLVEGAPDWQVVTDDVEDTAAALLPPEPANAKKPPTPSPTTTTQITATIVILRAWWARRERRCCWRSMRSRASLRCRSFLPVTDPFLLAACCLLTSETSRMVPAPARS